MYPGWLLADGDIQAVYEGDIPGDLRAELHRPHLHPAHAVTQDKLLQSAWPDISSSGYLISTFQQCLPLTAGEDCLQLGAEPPLRQHGEHHGLGDHAVVVGGPRGQVPEQPQQHRGRLPTLGEVEITPSTINIDDMPPCG